MRKSIFTKIFAPLDSIEDSHVEFVSSLHSSHVSVSDEAICSTLSVVASKGVILNVYVRKLVGVVSGSMSIESNVLNLARLLIVESSCHGHVWCIG